MPRIPLLLLLVVAFTCSMARAQVEISVSLDRSTYLLYEPVDVEVEVINVGEKSITLSNSSETKESWLQFVVQNAANNYIKPDVPISVPNKTLQPGESTTVRVNVMAGYQMRATGQYKAQAVVRVNGDTTYVAPFILINVGGGETIWQQYKAEKKYSLIRFLLDNQTFLYLRIEDVKQGVVYCTRQLGPCNLSYKVPDPVFDRRGSIHVLHPRSPIEFRHSVIGQTGALMGQDDYDARWNFPALEVSPHGEVRVSGTKISDAQKNSREKLSDMQLEKESPSSKMKPSVP